MNKRETMLAGSLALALMAALMPFARMGVDFHHDGIMLKPALDVLSGQVLFRDTFMQYGALTCYIHALALWFSPTLWCLKLITVGAYGVTLYFLYASWRFILPISLSVVSCALYFLFIPCYEINLFHEYWTFLVWSSALALMFQSISLYALLRIIRGTGRIGWTIILGMSAAAIYWCRQPVGLIMFFCLGGVAVGLSLVGWQSGQLSKKAILVNFLVGVLIVSAPILLSISLRHAVGEWIYQNYLWPKKWAQMNSLRSIRDMNQALGGPFILRLYVGLKLGALLIALLIPSLWQVFGSAWSKRALLFYFVGLGSLLIWQHALVLNTLNFRDGGWVLLLAVLVIGQALASIARAITRKLPAVGMEFCTVSALGAIAAGSLAQFYPLADPWHVAWSLAPSFGLCVYLLWRLVGRSSSVVLAVLSLSFLSSYATKIYSAKQFLAQPSVSLTSPGILRGMRVPPAQADTLIRMSAIVSRIENYRPNIPSLMTGNDAIFLCFTKNLTNPSAYFVTWPNLAPDAKTEERARASYIEKFRPMMIFSKVDWAATNDFYRRSAYIPIVYFPAEMMEIAIPSELAKMMGVSAYGADRWGRTVK
jgi:hypothetical protein